MTNKYVKLVVTITAVLFMLPFAWTLITALKPSPEILQYPPSLIPESPTLFQFRRIFEAGNALFLNYIRNTFIMSGSAIVLGSVVSMLAGYALAALPFRGSNFIFVLILAILMIPFQALLVPLYVLLSNLGLLNTYLGLILIYTTFQMPFCLFMFRNYFGSLPVALRESAIIEGASELRVLFQLYMPLSVPALATVIVYIFLETWNDFILSLVFTSGPSAQNIQVGIMQFGTTRFSLNWGIINAGTAVSVIPPVIVFLLLQKYYVKGLTSGFSK